MFSRNVIPQGQKQENVEFLEHHPHTYEPEPAPGIVVEKPWHQEFIQKKLEFLQFVSIDPSTKNLGFRIEKRFADGRVEMKVLERISFIDTAKDRRKKGLEPLKNPNKIEIIPTLYRDITTYLNKYREEYLKSHVILIERQLDKNYKCVRVAQHVISYFCLLLADAPLYPDIIEIDSKQKYSQWGSPANLNETGKKQWLIARVMELCLYRKDYTSYDLIVKSKGKQDDLSDTIGQLEAYCRLRGYSTVLTVHNYLQLLAQCTPDTRNRPVEHVHGHPLLKIQAPAEDPMKDPMKDRVRLVVNPEKKADTGLTLQSFLQQPTKPMINLKIIG
jgi:hypothetical protein